LKEIAGVGRGRRIGLLLGYQNMPQVQDQYGHDGANAILGAVGTTIFLPGLDDATSQFASRRIGQTTSWSRTTIDAHGRSADSERQSETGRALMDPTELRQMVKHSQCVVIIDTAPPIKAAYPEYAVRKERAIADVYGEPRLVSLLEAEEVAGLQRAVGMTPELTAIGNQGEAAAGFFSPPTNGPVATEADGANGSGLGGGSSQVAGDAVYQEMFARLMAGQMPEDAESQSPLALLVARQFYHNKAIKSWEDIKALDLASRSTGLDGKKSVAVSTVDSAQTEAPVDVSTVVGLGGAPAAITNENGRGKSKSGGKGKSVEQQYLFYSDESIAEAFVDSASAVVKEPVLDKPVPSARFLEKASMVSKPQSPVAAVDALR
jgi:hypothetical protein